MTINLDKLPDRLAKVGRLTQSDKTYVNVVDNSNQSGEVWYIRERKV